MSIRVTPDTIQARLNEARAGDEIVLQPGTYKARLTMEDCKGTVTEPIVLRAEPGAVLDGGMTADGYRIEANHLARDLYEGLVPGEPKRSYPGLWPWMHKGQLSLRRCRHVELRGLAIRGSWPTLIALEDVRDIRIAGAWLQDGAFAIGALGRDTSGITIEDCEWEQDRVPGRIWQQIAWRRIHGDPTDPEDGLVDVQNDWRLFDGDFFRGRDIRGGVRIRRCTVSSAFNAVHLFNTHDDQDLCRDVEVSHCRFRDIRDNVFEPEECAHNWWFHHNDVINSYKCFSFEQKRSGFFYIFANQIWYHTLPGPAFDKHRGGSLFKTAKSISPSRGRHFFFNNSISTFGDYISKGFLTRFLFQNNALRLAAPGDPGYREDVGVFGDLAALPADVESRFTTAWRADAIAVRNDLVAHPTWPAALVAAGYPIENGLAGDPLFRDPFAGDLRLARKSPCRRKAAELHVTLPDGTDWSHPAGGDIGAWQGDALLEGPEFMATAVAVA